MSNYPCKDCTEREIGCHGTCEKYAKAKEKRDDGKAERKRLICDINEMNLNSMRRNRIKWRDRKW